MIQQRESVLVLDERCHLAEQTVFSSFAATSCQVKINFTSTYYFERILRGNSLVYSANLLHDTTTPCARSVLSLPWSSSERPSRLEDRIPIKNSYFTITLPRNLQPPSAAPPTSSPTLRPDPKTMAKDSLKKRLSANQQKYGTFLKISAGCLASQPH